MVQWTQVQVWGKNVYAVIYLQKAFDYKGIQLKENCVGVLNLFFF